MALTATKSDFQPVSHSGDFGHVAVLMGGLSAEREISLKSGSAVLAALKNKGVDAVAVDVDENIVSTIEKNNFDRVFIILHGRGGEDGVMQAAMEVLGLPYTGSGILGSALSMDKLRTKQVWTGAGLPTPAYEKLDENSDFGKIAERLGLPLIVKPSREGSSIGMSKVDQLPDLKLAWEKAAEYDNDVIAEKWIEGEEYTVAILQQQSLPMIRLQTPNAFYDYEAKYESNATSYYCPCGLDAAKENELQHLAMEAFDVVGASGWGRIDFMLDASGSPWLIEANTIPGMTDHSLVPMAAKAAGMNFDDLVWKILETSCE
ncbi:MAG: D-alanine--D-alanine ligase [Gammaproteobacteria bacterium]|nr:D-alanine--D-alanine ligase [Gammaproteobacteria bacterium]